MPTDYFARINTADLYPPFLRLARQALESAERRGAIYIVTSGYRSVDQQNALYAKGRTAPGGIVTKARGGYSAHNWKVALDGCADGDHDKPGLQPNYDRNAYLILGEEAQRVGLEWGGAWTGLIDMPHIQLPLKKHGLTFELLLSINRAGGMPAVFERLDSISW